LILAQRIDFTQKANNASAPFNAKASVHFGKQLTLLMMQAAISLQQLEKKILLQKLLTPCSADFLSLAWSATTFLTRHTSQQVKMELNFSGSQKFRVFGVHCSK
jgi:hypothetical protein